MLLVVPQNHSMFFAIPQYGIVSLASMLRHRGMKVEVFETQFYKNFTKPLLEAAARHDHVGFYTTTFSYTFVKNMSALIKRESPRTKIILGGPHASHEPADLVRDFADIVVSGEGEHVLPRIVSGEPLENIPSVTFRAEAGEVIENEEGDLSHDLDSLPLPAWEMFNCKGYKWTHYRARPLVSLLTSRGCRFKCIYCAQGLISKFVTRGRSVGSVISEIEWDSEKHGIREVVVVDDDFTYDVNRVKEICRALTAKGLNRKVFLQKPNAIRPDRGDQEMFHLMKKAGFYFISIAVEAVDPEVSRKLGRALNGDEETMRDTIAMAKNAGLFVNTFYLMGSPFDTRETMMKNIIFSLSCRTDTVSFFGMKAFPGTALHNMLVSEGALENIAHQEVPSCNEITANYTANDWDENDLRRLVARAYRKFYLSPLRMFRLLFKLKMVISDPVSFAKQVYCLLFEGSPAADSAALRAETNRELAAIPGGR